MIVVPQQNTYDTAMNGANTFIGSYWVCALKAAAEMATIMGDTTSAKAYAARAALAKDNYEKTCWKESFGYYIADVNIHDCKFSYGPGCFVDQLCAIGLSSACGLGYNFDPAHEASARKAIIKNNQVEQKAGQPYVDLQKHFFPGDKGITVCSYPNGKLGSGMQYETLVSSGFVSPVIAGAVLDRNMEGAIEAAGHLRQRHDGRHRSPWNEPECGLLYSRAMAHWNIFDQACGHTYDSHTGALSFDPRSTLPVPSAPGETMFQCFIIVQDGWGTFSQTGPPGLPSGRLTLQCLFGTVAISSLGVVSTAGKAIATLHQGQQGKPIAVTFEKGVVSFPGGLRLPKGSSLTISLSPGDDIPSDGVAIAFVPPTCDAKQSLRSRKQHQHKQTEKPSARHNDNTECQLTVPTSQTQRMVVLAVLFFLLGVVGGDTVKAVALALARFITGGSYE